MSRYKVPRTVSSTKKNRLMTLFCDELYQTYNLELSRKCSCVAWGFCDSQIRTLCRFTLPETWRVALSEKKVVDKKSGSASRRSSIVLANSTRLGLSFGSRRCINCTLYAYSLRCFWTIRCNVDFGFTAVGPDSISGRDKFSWWCFSGFFLTCKTNVRKLQAPKVHEYNLAIIIINNHHSLRVAMTWDVDAP